MAVDAPYPTEPNIGVEWLKEGRGATRSGARAPVHRLWYAHTCVCARAHTHTHTHMCARATISASPTKQRVGDGRRVVVRETYIVIHLLAVRPHGCSKRHNLQDCDAGLDAQREQLPHVLVREVGGIDTRSGSDVQSGAFSAIEHWQDGGDYVPRALLPGSIQRRGANAQRWGTRRVRALPSHGGAGADGRHWRALFSGLLQ